ncbi:MAG TPA: 6-carboxytetrahydropterin synthase QueD [Spirochaetota bacterium]|nr:6-carboxytetrahydropterin synthase QueD [Spirochaetota bacterium]HOM37887.1 6-carboxytetrahydropterin synthase QueD [Spirochaetota bacterium]HPQ48691.1 6-carboxytetrahydropterin synthase QueD [Spirochaetota bacterium]
MYMISVEDSFSSAHSLRGYEGKCENLHGHNWKVRVTLKGEKLNNIGILIDFKNVKKILKDILLVLDHKFLNEITPFDKINPSAENIAFFIYGELKKKLEENIKIDRVEIWESEKAFATYYEGE